METNYFNKRFTLDVPKDALNDAPAFALSRSPAGQVCAAEPTAATWWPSLCLPGFLPG